MRHLNIKLRILFIIIIAVFISCTSVLNSKDIVVIDKNLSQGTLSNGMTYYFYPSKEEPNKVSIQVIVKTGSLYEEEEERGLSHLIEHMAFNSTEKYNEKQFKQIERELGIDFGADSNASTAFYYVNYSTDMVNPTSDRLDKLFDVMSQRVLHITFAEDQLEAEKGVVLAEKRLSDANEDTQEFFFSYNKILADTPFPERLPIGLQKNINNASPTIMKNLYHKWYRPTRIAIAIVGDVSQDQVMPYVETYFGSFVAPADAQPEEPKVVEFTDTHETRYYGYMNSSAIANTIQIVHRETEPNPLFIEDNMEQFVESGISRYIQELFSNYLVYKNYDSAIFSLNIDFDHFVNTQIVRELSIIIDENKFEEGLEESKQLLAYIEQRLSSPEGLERVKVLLSQFLNDKDIPQHQSYATVQNSILDTFIYHKPFSDFYKTIKKYSGKIISSLTQEQLSQVMQKYVYDEKNKHVFLSVGIVGSSLVNAQEGSIVDSVNIEIDQLVNERFSNNEIAITTPSFDNFDLDTIVGDPSSEGKIVSEKKVAVQETVHTSSDNYVYEWVLSNGMKVYFETYHPSASSPEKFIITSQNIPSRYLFDNRHPFLSRVIKEAFLNSSVEGYPLEVVLSEFDSEVEFFSAQVTDLKKIERAFQSIYFMYTKIDVTKAGVERAKYEIFNELSDGMRRASTYSFSYVNDVLKENYQYFQSLLDPSVVSNLSFEQIKDAVDAKLHSENTEFFMVGNIAPDKARMLVEKWIATIPTDSVLETDLQAEKFSFSDRSKVIQKTRIDSEDISFVFRSVAQRLTPEEQKQVSTRNVHIATMTESFLKKYLEEVIREDLGGAYYVFTRISFPGSADLPQKRLIIYFPTDPKRAPELYSALEEAFQSVNTISEMEFVNVKNVLLSSFENERSNPSVSTVLQFLRSRANLDFSQEYSYQQALEEIHSITREEVNAFFQEVKKGANLSIITNPAQARVGIQ